MSVLKSLLKRATCTPFLFCSWSLRNTNSLSLPQKQTLSLWLPCTHTVLLHSHSHSKQSSSHSIKPEDRCWISFLEEKCLAPFIGVELAWRAGEAGAPREERMGEKCVYACACVSSQSSHLLRGKEGAFGKAGSCNWRAWRGQKWSVVGCCHVVTVACQPSCLYTYTSTLSYTQRNKCTLGRLHFWMPSTDCNLFRFSPQKLLCSSWESDHSQHHLLNEKQSSYY